MTKTLEIKGLAELQRAVADAPEIALPIMTAAMEQAVALLHDAVATYPPATEANRPGRFRNGRPVGYYERGRGWWMPITNKAEMPRKTGKALGVIRGNKKFGTVGYKLAGGGKSELLGRKWTTTVTKVDGGMVGEVGNTASYAREVQGDRQKPYHARRGWPTLDGTVDRLAEDIIRIFEDAAGDVARAIGGDNAT